MLFRSDPLRQAFSDPKITAADCRMHRNAPYRAISSKKIPGEGAQSTDRPSSPVWEANTPPKPHPLGACGASTSAPRSPTLDPPLYRSVTPIAADVLAIPGMLTRPSWPRPRRDPRRSASRPRRDRDETLDSSRPDAKRFFF